MVAASVSLESLCVNSIRMLAVDAVNKSNSGHPGLPMGCAPMGYALWQNILNHNPNNPKWFKSQRLQGIQAAKKAGVISPLAKFKF